ncbi:hypothetical protein POM88_001916 [Heracleum sosnowskyi]|uniref:Pentatricopeptide repeat-containing protein n=1 Tax=Heracleum sosnowskyi TaxID=360622 RepID=A0AAD8JGT9_9APIA|nr:hypothetical protein POM88_001916 [Heracleum sosnowskyi]
MIRAFCNEGLLDEAKELFAKMKSSNCLPNDATYNTLIRGCFHNKKYNEASVLIDEMCARNFSADASTKSLLLVLLESKDQDPALLAFLASTEKCGWLALGLIIFLLAKTSCTHCILHEICIFQEWKAARREELSQYQKQVADRYVANVEKELERWQNARNSHKGNSDALNLQETMDRELETTHRLEHGPKKVSGGGNNEDDMMDDVLDVDEDNGRGEETMKAHTDKGSFWISVFCSSTGRNLVRLV